MPEEPAGNAPQTDSGTIVIPDAQEETPVPEPQDGGDTFMIEDEPQNAGQPVEVPDAQGETTIPGEPEDSPQPDAGQKAANEPAKDVESQPETPQNARQNAAHGEQRENNQPQDGLIIEFNDDFGGTDDNPGSNATEDNRQDGYDLEDEYYDLEGF